MPNPFLLPQNHLNLSGTCFLKKSAFQPKEFFPGLRPSVWLFYPFSFLKNAFSKPRQLPATQLAEALRGSSLELSAAAAGAAAAELLRCASETWGLEWNKMGEKREKTGGWGLGLDVWYVFW